MVNCRLLAMTLIFLVGGSVAPEFCLADSLIDRIPLYYEGEMRWSYDGVAQLVRFRIDKPRSDADGILIAKGTEDYWVVGKFYSVDIEMKVNPLTGRVEIQEIPPFHPFNVTPPPLVGMFSRDLKEIWSIDDDLADMSVDFRLYSSFEK